eukprot:gnl/TRDRNA2_/TRDRNA2_174083_c1_seq1.p1 gnl/TRDRNA2_/TRDRNA2_174083_c1~~gnl/TRDRNA2_/TRDRNA2_174083_c1_seq1.p1  ORF type:complete len:210 (+),score=34.78 gnl/TRDRNA2_/TRDRNA2_174083_c1_seq1:54-683(+)
MLPAGASVGELRGVLEVLRAIPENTKVYTERDVGFVVLKDSDVVPPNVAVSEFKGSRSFYIRFTKRQTRKIFRTMLSFFKKREVQDRLDALEKQCIDKSGQVNDMAYRGSVVKLLTDEVYPDVFYKLGLPDEQVNHRLPIIMEGVHHNQQDPVLAEMWFEVAVLTRNWLQAQDAYNQSVRLRALHGLPELPAFDACYQFIREIVKLNVN